MNFKRFILNSPEYILLLGVVFYWVSSTMLNPIALGLFIVILLQLIFKNNIAGIIIGSLLGLLTFYMFLALFSELSEFTAFNSDAWRLLLIGGTCMFTVLAFSVLLVYRSCVALDQKKA